IAGALAWLHEYARARANAAGMAEIGSATLGERPTRVGLTVLGIGMAGVVGVTSNALPAGIATFAVGVWIVLGIIGFVQLFATIHHELAGRPWRSRLRDDTPDQSAAVTRPHNLGLDPRYLAERRVPDFAETRPPDRADRRAPDRVDSRPRDRSDRRTSTHV